MQTVTVEEAQGRLEEIIAGLNPGEALVIVHNGEPVATLARTPSRQWPCKAGSSSKIASTVESALLALPKQWPCKAGSHRKAEFWMAPNFDAPLEDFKDYME